MLSACRQAGPRKGRAGEAGAAVAVDDAAVGGGLVVVLSSSMVGYLRCSLNVMIVD